ncbi:hypothetical protein P4T35_25540, partial [Aneurinibacillus migulanus]|nr:hypothetical protein [Aneurinibacillus migulanus]
FNALQSMAADGHPQPAQGNQANFNALQSMAADGQPRPAHGNQVNFNALQSMAADGQPRPAQGNQVNFNALQSMAMDSQPQSAQENQVNYAMPNVSHSSEGEGWSNQEIPNQYESSRILGAGDNTPMNQLPSEYTDAGHVIKKNMNPIKREE